MRLNWPQPGCVLLYSMRFARLAGRVRVVMYARIYTAGCRAYYEQSLAPDRDSMFVQFRKKESRIRQLLAFRKQLVAYDLLLPARPRFGMSRHARASYRQ